MVEGIIQKSISSMALKLGMFNLEPSGKMDLLKVHIKGIDHYIAVDYKKDSQECVVFGTGAVNKKKVEIPYFDRLSWHDKLPCSVIYYFDSTLFLNERVNLGWLYGTNQHWYLSDVEIILRALFKKMKIDDKRTIFVGSSGGGFTSCALAALFDSKALVYNPQLICKILE